MTFHPNIINFFKEHNLYDQEAFEYFSHNTMMIDYNDEETRIFIGCNYLLDKKNILKRIFLIVPYVENEKTMLINIHELIHAIVMYQNINKKFIKDITIEALPMLYEKIYILEKGDQILVEYGNYLDSIVIDSKISEEYSFGLSIREKLLEKYDKNIIHMKKLTKKLAKNYLKH